VGGGVFDSTSIALVGYLYAWSGLWLGDVCVCVSEWRWNGVDGVYFSGEDTIR
jgi:hypothetical protein